MRKILPISLITILTIFSCETDFEQSSIFISNSQNIEEAKTWIGSKTGPILEMTPTALGLDFTTNKNSEKPIPFQYDWKYAFESENEDFSVVEVPLKTQGWFGMAEGESLQKFKTSNNIGYLSSITRLIVIRNKKTSKGKNKLEGYIMTIIGDVDYLEKKKFQLLNNTYLYKEDDFSGTIFFRTLDGDFVNGWRMREGSVVGKIFESKNKVGLTASVYCNTYSIYTTYQQCTDWYNIGETSDATYITYNGTTCNIWQEYSGSYSECEETIDVNTGSSGGSSGPYVQGGDVYCKSGLTSSMTPQIENLCVPSIMEYINNEYCGGNSDQGLYLTDYAHHYGKNPLNGVDYVDIVNFTNRHFTTTSFSGYQNSIDNGNILMAGIPTTTPGIGHNVAIVGYKSNGDLIYMDPETGQFETRPQSFFSSSVSYVITITGCK